MMFSKKYLVLSLILTAIGLGGCLPPTTTEVEPPISSTEVSTAVATAAVDPTAQPTEEPTAVSTATPVPTQSPATLEPKEPTPVPPPDPSPLAGLVFRRFDDAIYQINQEVEIVQLGDDDLLVSPGLTRGVAVDFADPTKPLNVFDLLNPNAPAVSHELSFEPLGCWSWQDENIVLCGVLLPSTPEGPHLGQMARIDVNTGRAEVLTEDRLSFSPPSVSTDGATIVFDVGDNELMVWEDNAATLFDFAAYENGSFVPAQGVGSPSLSPDGSKLAVIFGGSPARYIVFDLTANTARDVASFEPIGFGGYFPAAQWNPAGDRLAIQLLTSDPANQRVIVVSVDGAQLLDTAANTANPVWLNNDELLVQTVVDGTPQDNVVWNVVDGSQKEVSLPAGAFPIGVYPTTPPPVRLDEVFIDSFAGVTVNYPAGWTVIEVPDDVKSQSGIYANTFNQFDPNATVGGGGGIPLGTSKFDLVIQAGDFPDLEAAIAERDASFEQAEFSAELLLAERVTLPSGLEAYYRKIYSTFAGQVTEYATVHDGRMIIISGIGNPRLVDEIAMTLRPMGD